MGYDKSPVRRKFGQRASIGIEKLDQALQPMFYFPVDVRGRHTHERGREFVQKRGRFCRANPAKARTHRGNPRHQLGNRERNAEAVMASGPEAPRMRVLRTFRRPPECAASTPGGAASRIGRYGGRRAATDRRSLPCIQAPPVANAMGIVTGLRRRRMFCSVPSPGKSYNVDARPHPGVGQSGASAPAHGKDRVVWPSSFCRDLRIQTAQ